MDSTRKYVVRLYPDGVKEVVVDGVIEDVLKIIEYEVHNVKVRKHLDYKNLYSSDKELIIPKKSLFSIEEAILVILYINYMEGIYEVAGLKLSKCLKKAGYSFKRVDRIISKFLKENICTSIGTKRNIKYSLTKNGINLIENILQNKQI